MDNTIINIYEEKGLIMMGVFNITGYKDIYNIHSRFYACSMLIYIYRYLKIKLNEDLLKIIIERYIFTPPFRTYFMSYKLCMNLQTEIGWDYIKKKYNIRAIHTNAQDYYDIKKKCYTLLQFKYRLFIENAHYNTSKELCDTYINKI